MSDLISRQGAINKCRTRLYESAVNNVGYKCDADKVFVDIAENRIETWLNELPSAQPEIIRCKDCGHFHYDMPYVIQGVPVLGHEVCDFWGDGCKTSENGYCSFAERWEDERPES